MDMIWKNAELYNVSELVQSNDHGGYAMLRIPQSAAAHLNEGAQRMNRACCGVEIRFRLNSENAKITLSMDDDANANLCTRPLLYYGNIGAGWQNCLKNVYSAPTEIVIPQPDGPKALKRIHEENNMPFSSEVVRVILQNQHIRIYDIQGDIEPPRPGDVPKTRYLAYGSSITHGSLALLPVNTWTNRIAENMNADLINLGFAGSAHLEPQMADYIASRNDFDFATLEMGANILDIEPSDFRGRVHNFVSTIANAHPDKPFFCIDVLYGSSDLFADGKAVLFRQIVREVLAELKLPNTIYIDGLKILSSSKYLSGDFVHPNVRGVEEIAANLTAEMKKYFANA